MADEQVKYDVDGYELVTKALWDLLNQYPALADGDEFLFAEVDQATGKAFIPTSGAAITTEIADVTDHVEQTCMYPFMIITKAAGLSENNKVKVKEWLDNLGRWLELQTVTINNKSVKLGSYPTLTGTRKFKNITRTGPSYLQDVSNDNVEQWVISLEATYTNEFDK